MGVSDLLRIRLGTFIRPGDADAGIESVIEVVNAYVIRHGDGHILVDTGIGEVDEETEQFYRPRRRPLPEALDEVGVHLEDMSMVVNCHLHFDHCGGNLLFPRKPIVTQRTELDLAQNPGHTVPELIDFPGVRYEILDGEAELMDGVSIVPTPGHTPGHQTVVVRGEDGTVIVAGQQHEHAADFTADMLAARAEDLGHTGGVPVPPAWMDHLLDLDPKLVVFAHDDAVWVPTSPTQVL